MVVSLKTKVGTSLWTVALFVVCQFCALCYFRILWRSYSATPNVSELYREKYQSAANQAAAPPFADGQHTLGTLRIRYPCPKVYKYKLDKDSLESRVAPGRGHMDAPYPDPWGSYLYGPEKKGFHATKHKSAPAVIERLLDNYGNLCLTENPHEADLFYIPWYRDWYCGMHQSCDHYSKESRSERALFELIQNQTLNEFNVNFFKRNNATDHFQISATMAALNLVPKRLKWFLPPWTNIITFSSVGGSAAYHPFVSFARFESGMRLDQLPWRYDPTKRDILVFMAWGSTQGARHALIKQCDKRVDKCLSLVNTRNAIYRSNSMDSFTSIVEGYQRATFCVQKGQETCTRKGIVDAMLLGCVVVVFSSCPLEYLNDYIDPRRAMLQIHQKYLQKGLIEILESIPEDVVADMQMYIARNGHRLQYSRINDAEQYNSLADAEKYLVHQDAFFTLLRTAMRHALRSVQCDARQGYYQPRFGICCERNNSCDPVGLLAMGIGHDCAVKPDTPCFYEEAVMHDLWGFDKHKQNDPIGFNDFLRGPKPWTLSELPPMTKSADW